MSALLVPPPPLGMAIASRPAALDYTLVPIPEPLKVSFWSGSQRSSWTRKKNPTAPPTHKAFEGTFGELAKVISEASEYRASKKGEGHNFVFGECEDGFRGNEHIREVYGLTLDFDNPPIDVARIKFTLCAWDVAFIVQERAGKLHIHIPIRPWDVSARRQLDHFKTAARRFFDFVQEAFGATVDKALASPVQQVFVYCEITDPSDPRPPPGPVQWHDGRALDLQTFSKAMAAASAAPTSSPTTVAPLREYDRAELLRLIDGKAPPGDRPSFRSLANGEAPPEWGNGDRNPGLFRYICFCRRELRGVDGTSFAEAHVDAAAQLYAGEPHREEATLAWWVDTWNRVGDDEDPWFSNLIRTSKGLVQSVEHNVALIVRFHEALSGKLGWDDRADEPVWISAPPWDPDAISYPRQLSDHDTGKFVSWVIAESRIPLPCAFGHKIAQQGLIDAAHAGEHYDPVVTYLRGVRWDGIPRVWGWVARYTRGKAEDAAIHQIMGGRWLIAAVARSLDPGCKADTVLVLEGEQGRRKSTALEELTRGVLGLGPVFSSDVLASTDERERAMHLRGLWICEMAEVGRYTRKEVNELKRWIGQREDRYRAPYARHTAAHPRRVAFAATTNDEEYLADATGGRRFWPICVTGDFDIELLRAERDQLWAEAVVHYDAGVQWWLTPEEEALAQALQEDRRETDPWENPLRLWLDGSDSGLGATRRDEVTTVEAAGCPGLVGITHTQRDFKRVRQCLQAIGWAKRDRRWIRRERTTA